MAVKDALAAGTRESKSTGVGKRKLPIGAELLKEGGVSFRVWAPKRKAIEVVFDNESLNPLALVRDEAGYFAGVAPQAKAGMLYRFRLDGAANLIPDPISRFQPQGVHGPSQIISAEMFQWTDTEWKGIGPAGRVLYEMHIGTFTAEGTWKAAADKLAVLKDVGINTLEVMPVGEFAGKFGWGYDSVDLFAPTRNYGTPDDFRSFVNEAHTLGMAVILDVVYNHLGPDGNYLKEFSDHYFTKKHANDWGESLNFDDDGAAGTREYFVSNAKHWISEYHLDGFRFDATQAILDNSKEHVLAEICREARVAAGARQIYLINENEPQHTRLVRPPEQGGYGMDALWNDDFHHTAMVALTGRNEAYFTDYLGKPQEFLSAAKWGYLYQGQFYKWQQKLRGTAGLDLPATAFVNYIQNHDQIANYGHGQRAHQLTSLAQFKAVTTYLLLAPQTPLLFQGQEFAASNTFHYFADHSEELNKLIHKGRLKELSQFPSNAQPDMQSSMPHPGSEETFKRSKIDWSEMDRGFHAGILQLHKDLLRLRREDPIFSRMLKRGELDGAVLGHHAFVMRYFDHEFEDRLVIVNLGSDLHLDIIPEPLLAPPGGDMPMTWKTIFSTEDACYGGNGSPPLQTGGDEWRLPGYKNWRLPGRSAAVLAPTPLTAAQLKRAEVIEQRREAQRRAGLDGKK